MYLLGVIICLWAFIDVTVDTLATEDVIQGYRRHGVILFIVAIGWFVTVTYFVRFLKRRRDRYDHVA
jgi:hypothetical protein